MMVEEVAKFIVRLKYDEVDDEAIEKAKLCFLDFLSVSYRGSHEKSSKIAIKTLTELFNGETSEDKIATVMANGYLNPIHASFLNGIFAHSLDLDDGHNIAQIHPGSVVFPSAIAISQMKDLNGEKFLEAVICGYEVGVVLGKIANPQHRNQGFHSTGTVGTFISGAVVSKLLNLNVKQTIYTLGLCGTTSSGLLESDHTGTMGKHLHVGNAAYNGLLCGFLGKNGFTGAESIVEGDEGFLNGMAVKTFENLKSLNLNSYLRKELGKFHIKDVYLKKYPFCRHLHSSIDSAIAIKKRINNFNINEIKRVSIETYKIASEHENFNPKTLQQLKQSLPFAIAIFLISDRFKLEDLDKIFVDEQLHSKIKMIAGKIEIHNNEEFDKLFPNKRASSVTISLKNNEKIQNTTYTPIGEKENPLLKENILNKFKTLNPNFSHEHLKQIDRLETTNMNEFMKKFAK
ncbi:MAG: MmgE/PrpD family protein [Methanobrevibacter sp.]|jgi:2-methylcitrate dehydratase PrpD|nr:MmgE/PrpD family protein [Candidatus Methanovirga aequatorialis]